MNKIIILYPRLFKSYSKFQRKVEKIISNLGEVSLVYSDDYNGFIERIYKENELIVEVELFDGSITNNITHAIIFDDGEEFVAEEERIKAMGIPLRHIKILITRVINISDKAEYKSVKSTPDYEYIGRGSYWGNPYSMYETGEDREEVIRKFKYDFDYEKFPKKEKKEVYKLIGKRLGCFCKPQACHGDILANYLNSYDDGK
ncbi:DUF4326 domain-containing protein [Psychrobacter pacificensis]|uniref:DUF4326 domain-containing protein n=1 Tax=Psychrobacter pacificensis TaxID=112002 RepID=UPI003D04C611